MAWSKIVQQKLFDETMFPVKFTFVNPCTTCVADTFTCQTPHGST